MISPTNFLLYPTATENKTKLICLNIIYNLQDTTGVYRQISYNYQEAQLVWGHTSLMCQIKSVSITHVYHQHIPQVKLTQIVAF